MLKFLVSFFFLAEVFLELSLVEFLPDFLIDFFDFFELADMIDLLSLIDFDDFLLLPDFIE